MSKPTYSVVDYERILTDIESEKWDDIFSSSDPNDCINIITQKITSLLHKHSTNKTKKTIKRKSPWVTDGLIRCFKKRDKLHIKCKKQPFNISLQNYYKKYRNKLNTIPIKAKNKYFSDQI